MLISTVDLSHWVRSVLLLARLIVFQGSRMATILQESRLAGESSVTC